MKFITDSQRETPLANGQATAAATLQDRSIDHIAVVKLFTPVSFEADKPLRLTSQKLVRMVASTPNALTVTAGSA
jgi:hypothetical protein